MSFRDRSLRWQLALLVVLCLVLEACASPVRAVRVDRKVAHANLARSAITSGEPSWPTQNVLQEHGLVEDLDKRPEAVLAELHRAMVASQGDPDLLFALAELSYLYGQKAARRDHLLAASVYAYAFLFPENGGARPDTFDPRLRNAADLYNGSLSAALASEDGSQFVPRGGRFELPFGGIEVTFDPAELRAGDRELVRFTPVAELQVEGLALTFTGIPVGELKLMSFLGRATGILAERPPLVSTSPYKPGLIPVVFVHGTISSPLTWAEMLNRLHGDVEIRKRFRQDPALRRIVLIGHSQGGLLVKMQSIHSGDQIWNAVSRKPLDELELAETTRALFRRGLFVEPLPEVTRVVFISTPHRGSFVAGYRFVASLARRLTRLPFELNSVSADLARNADAARVSRVPTATTAS